MLSVLFSVMYSDECSSGIPTPTVSKRTSQLCTIARVYITVYCSVLEEIAHQQHLVECLHLLDATELKKTSLRVGFKCTILC